MSASAEVTPSASITPATTDSKKKIKGRALSRMIGLDDGTTVRAARRSGILTPSDSFYNFQNLLATLTPNILQLFQLVAAMTNDDDGGGGGYNKVMSWRKEMVERQIIKDATPKRAREKTEEDGEEEESETDDFATTVAATFDHLAPSVSSSSSSSSSSPAATVSLNAPLPPLTGMTVFGEIYGGTYPHPDVPAAQVKRVQNGVYYSNRVHFIVFDVGLHGYGFLPFPLYSALCAAVQLPTTPVIQRGSFADCVTALDVEKLLTRVPTEVHHLPPIPNNFAEGVVVKPVWNVWDKFYYNRERMCLKLKRSTFDELGKERIGGDESEQAEKKKVTSDPSQKADMETMMQVLQAMTGYVNDNRLHNVISKIGVDEVVAQAKEKSKGKEDSDAKLSNAICSLLVPLLVKDALLDFAKDAEHHEPTSADALSTSSSSSSSSSSASPSSSNLVSVYQTYAQLDAKQHKIVGARLCPVAVTLVKSRLTDILAGTY